MAEQEVHGPIDFVLLEFQGENLTGKAAEALLDLVDMGIVRIWDLLIIGKDAEGNVTAIDIAESADGELGGFAAFAGASSGLLGADDQAQAAAALEPGTVAALIVYENAWAIPFIEGVRASGGELIASARIPAQDVMDALDALEND